MAHTPTPSTFSARLKLVLGNRKPTPWSENLLIPSGTMSRMFKGDGVPPTYETLAKITRTENVSLSWLIEGVGSPYLIALVPDDAELTGEVETRLQEEPSWRIDVLTDGQLLIVVLSQPAQIVEKRGNIEYIAVDVFGGVVAPKVMDMLARYGQRVTMKKWPRERLIPGLRLGLGTFQLLGDAHDGKRTGLLADGRYAIHPAPRLGIGEQPPDFQYADTRYAPLRAGMGRLSILMQDMQDDELLATDILLSSLLDRVEARKHRQ